MFIQTMQKYNALFRAFFLVYPHTFTNKGFNTCPHILRVGYKYLHYRKLGTQRKMQKSRQILLSMTRNAAGN